MDNACDDGVKLFLCDPNNCLECQIINDIPWTYISKIVNCTQDEFPSHNINVPNDLEGRINEAKCEQSQNEIRKEIAELSIKKNREWFKHIPGGEFLGSLFMEAYEEMHDNILKRNIETLVNWCGIKND